MNRFPLKHLINPLSMHARTKLNGFSNDNLGLTRVTTAHSWCGGHSIRINACGVWKGKDRDSSFQKGVSCDM